jgi:hypothetical protein
MTVVTVVTVMTVMTVVHHSVLTLREIHFA